MGVAVLVAHLATLPTTLEDSDSVNFALGVRHFDVAQHQPHPPGYPVFIALATVATRTLSVIGVTSPDVRGLAVWGAIGAGLLVPLLFVFFRAVDGDEVRSLMAAALSVCAPLMWLNAARPLSDTVGLAVAFAGLAALAAARTDDSVAARREWLGGVLVGLAIGIRSQNAILALPFVALVLFASRRRVMTIGALAIGIAVWAIPLVVLSGGPSGYLRALRSQAGDDFSGVVMLWTNPTPRVAMAAVLDTFVRPWGSPVLGGIVVALATGGAIVLALRAWRTLAIVALTFGPYAVFHLLFQEPLTTRYALPLLPLVAYLAAATLAEAAGPYRLLGGAALAAASLVIGVPVATAFAREPSPIFALLSETALLGHRGAQPVIGMHRRVFTESRRARIYAGDPPGTLLGVPRDFEWLEMTRRWREGHDGESWFFADPRRTDLALIDRSHARVREYRWPLDAKVYLGGVRPNNIDWYIFNQPTWFLEHGWALTPEAAGISDREGWGPHRSPSTGWIRRRAADHVMVIGGRHLANGAPPASVVASLDGRAIASFDAQPGYFMHFVDVPAAALAGEGRYAALTVTAQASGSAPAPPLAIEQFDFQPRDQVVFGLADGWYEPEYNPSTAQSWRWISDRAVVRIHDAGRPVSLRFRAEAPGRYFTQAPRIRVMAGDQVLSEVADTDEISVAVRVPAEVISAAKGLITLTSDRTFVAGEREGTADRRKLALRIYSLTVEETAR